MLPASWGNNTASWGNDMPVQTRIINPEILE